MVVFINLEDEAEDPADRRHGSAGFAARRSQLTNDGAIAPGVGSARGPLPVAEERPNPNLNVVSEALGCYPIVSLLASYIDLNTLHALARTCRQIRANLIQYRHQLIQQTLRCSNEIHDDDFRLTELPLPDQERWHMFGESGLISSGKVSSCARDLVSDCRRCGTIVCRNCTLKPPSSTRLPLRLRRLCPACLAAPLTSLTNRPGTNLCTCADAVHLCLPCGSKRSEADTQYQRVWNWRTRYTTFLGGVGTGVGEGNEGSKCARGAACLGAMDVEVELDCPIPWREGGAPVAAGGSGSGVVNISVGESSASGSESDGGGTPYKEKEEAGYWRQEIEGLGGVVKKKFRKRERVGGTVREWEDEIRGGEYLMKEKRGEERSWCGWCGRVVAAKDEALE